MDHNNIFHGGRLFQQYVVDAWAPIEQSNLNWIHQNQTRLRADCYQGLTDNILNNDRWLLHSSFSSGPQHMYQMLQDSLAICRFCLKPDLFLMMTANGSWPEITENLLPGQSAVDHPDLVAHVFYQKQQALLKKVRAGYYGKVAGLVYTIEYQKRGLPHMHLLIFLEAEYKIRMVE
ncbi:hypothetical protein CY34DRAFT_26716 [Suillus luteus UH-Slu-Lm8-n1]|uniref:Helitron helicase-like domain-containing protein n=1 Tax=Suillus luteus UH-Slu-Lm8-n1 TaxID=930992 RepID=A0A0D0ASX1_9AGAM|nr:hypothetical protein CY34DRAFT_26716 [Suillus luteus UH-Slu-Lm8-n1]